MAVPDDKLLDGITVLDFTRVLAGPWATRMLADNGARVIKIERAGEGDDTRRGYAQLEEGRTDQSTYFTRINAGKLSIGIDLTRPAARALVADLVRHADVVIENFVPGVVDKLGCDYRSLSGIKPDLVYCSISGFGQTGPLRGWPAFAHIIDAVSGLMDLGRDPDPEPRVAYLQAADVLAGTHAFGAINAALLRRFRTGRGAHLDVSMLEAVVAAEDLNYGALLNAGEPLRGARSGMLVHRIGDRAIVTQTVGSPQLWPRLLALMDRPELADDPRFATPILRRRNWLDLKQIIVEWLDKFPTADAALAALSAARLPSAPVLTPEEVVAHPHLAARRFFPEVPHPGRGRVRITGMPFHVDGAPVDPTGPAPYRPGEHTRTILSEILGYAEDRIAAPRVLLRLRDQRFRRVPSRRVGSDAGAAAFVDAVGFCSTFYRFPEGVACLWEAVVGRRDPRWPRRSHHDRGIGLTWELKDRLPAQRRVYYGKLLRGKPLLVALDVFPAFYALVRGRQRARDYRAEYEAGRMSATAKRILDALVREHPQYTRELRANLFMLEPARTREFERAMGEVQQGLWVVKSEERYDPTFSYRWDLVESWLPDGVAEARRLSRPAALERLIARYIGGAVYTSERALARLFGVRGEEIAPAVARLATRGVLVPDVAVPGWPGRFVVAAGAPGLRASRSA